MFSFSPSIYRNLVPLFPIIPTAVSLPSQTSQKPRKVNNIIYSKRKLLELGSKKNKSYLRPFGKVCTALTAGLVVTLGERYRSKESSIREDLQY